MNTTALIQQVGTEYNEGQNFLRPRKLRWVKQLVLMNNLRRDEGAIASTLLFSTFTRVLSDLYDDSKKTVFVAGGDADYKKSEAWEKASQNDYREMGKAMIDYDWLWDTLFFGAGNLETLNFDRERLIMRPEVINPLMFVHDPQFAEVQEWRYYGKWVTKSRSTLLRLYKKGVILVHPDSIAIGVEPELWDYKIKREAAKDVQVTTPETQSPNGIYQILEHFTYDEDGDKCLVWVDKAFNKLVRYEKLKLGDGEDGESRWPLIRKQVFREPHSTAAVSLPDIVEDKHRATNVVLNLAYLAAKDEANPMYAYDENVIKDVTAFFQRQLNQHIAVDGDPSRAVVPLNTKPALTTSILEFLTILKSEGSEPVGTTQITPPMPQGRKTASEAALLQQVVDLTKSLQSKLVAQSEQEFWSHWYWRLKRHMRDADKKFIALMSVTGTTFSSLAKDDLIGQFPPNVVVTSEKEAEFKNTVERQALEGIMPILGNISDPSSFRLFLKHVYFPKFRTIDSSTIETILPNSIDELKAQQENAQLEKDELPQLDPQDDDTAHLYIHAQAKNTAATWAHRFAHEQQIAKKRAESSQAATAPDQTALPPGTPAPDQPTAPSADQAATAIPLQPIAENATAVPSQAVQ